MNLHPAKIAEWTGGDWDPRPPQWPLRGVTQDTRQLETGNLYVALRGPHFDGHAFVEDARRLGAAAAMVEVGFHSQDMGDWPLLRVDDPLRAMGAMAAGYRREWNARVTGITGSAGKTTVKEMLTHFLRGVDGVVPVAYTQANWNNEVGLPLSILNSMLDCKYGVFEVGTNHPGEIMPLAKILKPDVGVVTTVGEAHLQNFGCIPAIAREKSALLQALPPNGLAVLNRDHDQFPILLEAASCRVVTVTIDPDRDAHYRAEAVEQLADGRLVLSIALAAEKVRPQLVAPVSGRHQAANLLLAAATARELGCDWDSIAVSASTFNMPAMRWQRIQCAGVTVINDAYNANPQSMRAALETFAADPSLGSRRWLALGGMQELGEAADAAHAAIGREVARGGWQGVVTIGNSARGIAQSACKAGYSGGGSLWECDDVAAAAEVLRHRLQPGDALLLKGSRVFQLEKLIPMLMEDG